MPAAHAPSLYAAGDREGPSFPALQESATADVCVIGGGYTGLSAALHLAEAGRQVVLLEAERVGWGASGRNGGQLHSGQRRDQVWLEKRFGRETAMALWREAEDAKALVHALIARHAIACEWRPGLIEAVHRRRSVPAERAYVDLLRDRYGYDKVDWLAADAFAEATAARGYFGGRLDRGAGHLDPLKLALGLARAAEAAGARIFEGSRATRILGTAASGFRIATEVAAANSGGSAAPRSAARQDGGPSLPQSRPLRPRLRDGFIPSREGRPEVRPGPFVSAGIVLIAGNGYLDRIDRETERRTMPIVNYILATEPLGAGRPGGIIPGGEAVSDTRFVVYYWRPTADGRLVFGGGETYSRHPPADIPGFVRRHLLRVYPQLREARIDYGWGGRLAITLHRLPFIRRLRPGVYVGAGYSGQGVALAPYAGKLLADAIGGDPGRFDRLASLPCPPFPGGRLLRWPSLVAGMSWYALRDRL